MAGRGEDPQTREAALVSVIQLRLQAPAPQNRSAVDLAAQWLPPVTRDIHTMGRAPGRVPGIVSACATRLSAALLAGGGPPEAVHLTPWAAWRLMSHGEALLVVRVRRGRPILLPANLVSMMGNFEDPVYSVEVPGPDRSLALNNLTRESVAHLILTPDPARPWRGQSWMGAAGTEGGRSISTHGAFYRRDAPSIGADSDPFGGSRCGHTLVSRLPKYDQ